MPFRKQETDKRKMGLISLMDLIFILLIFFLVTNLMTQSAELEQKLYVPSPEDVRGRAQILVQLLEDGTVLWLDENSTRIVESVIRRYGFEHPDSLRRRILNTLLRQSIISGNDLNEKLNRLVNYANSKPNHRYFVLIRCPDMVPYYRTIKIISALAKAKHQNIKYGCVGGTIDQIQNCKNIEIVKEHKRRNLWVDF